MPTLEQLEEELKCHDWYFDYSDDHRVWKNGQAHRDKIRGMMSQLKKDHPEEVKALWNKYAPAEFFRET